MISSSHSKNIIPNSSFSSADPTIIIFECNDVRRDTGLLLLLKRKKDNDNKFELHLHNDYYTCQAIIAMVLSIEDLARMFESLGEYFQSERADNRRRRRT